MKYFGTDGIRGIVGKCINKDLLKRISFALIKFYNKHKLKRILLVGNDSRETSDYILTAMASFLLKHGIEIHNLEMCSSPALAYICKKYNYPLAMMISASHNPCEYNGIKFFNFNGEKISDETEFEMESYMDRHFRVPVKYANLMDKRSMLSDYINHLKELKKFDIDCIFDCASGGASEIVKACFPQSKKINCSPSGNNINKDAGCTHIEMLKQLCLSEHKMGFALDGDADRIYAVTENGEIVDGDKILYILSKFYLHKGESLIGTIYSNMGLEDSLRREGIHLVRADVGDKKVFEQMKKVQSNLGGEFSGHIIIKQLTNTGDGILTAIALLNIMGSTKMNLSALLKDYIEYYQASDNLKLDHKFEFSDQLKNLVDEHLKSGTRIIIRPSGTEPVLRIMVENKDKEKAIKILENIKNHIENM